MRDELGPQVLYIDEAGATDGRWACWAHDHGHNSYEIPYAGEVALLRRIREALGSDVARYTEYPPAEVSRRYLDGSITYQVLVECRRGTPGARTSSTCRASPSPISSNSTFFLTPSAGRAIGG